MNISESPRGRPILPTSSSEFALPFASADDTHHILNRRFRRPSVLAPRVYESRLNSPLGASFTLVGSRRKHVRSHSYSGEESDKERMWSDSSPSSSENCTPPVSLSESEDRDRTPSRHPTPQTPPRRSVETDSVMPKSLRKLSMPLKTPRVLRLLAESCPPEEDEVKSEAAFQKFIAASSELPVTPHTPRATSDRGRYPEEVCLDDDYKREDTPSDDEVDNEPPFAFSAPGSSQPIPIKRGTPMTTSGDDMCISESPGTNGMDVDMMSTSPSFSSFHSSMSQWRYTPPPTSSATRSNKRKLEDRYDPYPSSKRRAVSPAYSHNRSPHPIRLPLAIPPGSSASSTASSPTISNAYLPYPLPMASPTLRATMALSSPVLRPMARSGGLRRGEGEEREVDGAGEGVGGLTLA